MRGHLRQRGKSWELRAYVGVDPITKRPKYLTRTLRCGKREAEEALARFVTEVSGGGHGAQDTTVGDLIREWFALATPELSPTTVKGYDWIIKAYIFPTLELFPSANCGRLNSTASTQRCEMKEDRRVSHSLQPPSARCMPSCDAPCDRAFDGVGSRQILLLSPLRLGLRGPKSSRRIRPVS